MRASEQRFLRSTAAAYGSQLGRVAASVPAAAVAAALYWLRFRGPFQRFFAAAPEPSPEAVAAALAGADAPLPGDAAALPLSGPSA